MTRLFQFALEQGTLMLVTAIWSFVGAVVLWIAISITNRRLVNPIARPAYWKTYATVFVPNVVVNLTNAILLAVDIRFPLAGGTSYVTYTIIFFLMSGLLIVLLPTTALRACLVAAVYLLILLATSLLFALVAEASRFLF